MSGGGLCYSVAQSHWVSGLGMDTQVDTSYSQRDAEKKATEVTFCDLL